MAESLLTLSPAIVLGITSLFCLIIGIIRSIHYVRGEFIKYTLRSIHSFMAVGCLGLVGDAMIFASISVYYRIILFIMIIVGSFVSIVGEFLLYRNIIHFKRLVFVIWIIVTGNLLFTLSLPVLLQLKEPFVYIYVLCIYITIPTGHLLLTKYWINKRNR